MVGPSCRNCQTTPPSHPPEKFLRHQKCCPRASPVFSSGPGFQRFLEQPQQFFLWVFPVSTRASLHIDMWPRVSVKVLPDHRHYFLLMYTVFKKQQPKKANTNNKLTKRTKRNSDIFISTFLDKEWAGICQLNNVQSSSQLDDRHMHSAGKGNILKTKPIFLFQARSEPWQADLAGSCRSSRHPYK